MLETSARLLRLLTLFQSRRTWSGPELAARLEVTPRTLRRDVGKLRTLGYPVAASTGTAGGYQMGAGEEMPPLLLDDGEAVAVAVALRQLSGAGEAPERALAKIDQLLPARLRRRVTALQTMIVGGGMGPGADARLVAQLASACRDMEALRFSYRDNAGRATSREAEPYRLVHAAGRWYLVAWDRSRADWRTFRVDRIGGAPVPLGRSTARPGPSENLVAFVLEGYWKAREKCRARVRLYLPAAEAAVRVAGGGGAVEAAGEDWCWYETGASCWDALAGGLLWTGARFEVDEPPELVAALERAGDRARAALPGQRSVKRREGSSSGRR